MLLDGIAPVLIFSFIPTLDARDPLFNAIAGIPVIGEDLVTGVLPLGIPIPLYLDERLTGIYVDNESKNIDIETVIDTRYDTKRPVTIQRALNSSVTINLFARKDSILLSAFLALHDLVIPRLVSKTYAMSYINGPTVILNGLLQSLSHSVDMNTDLIRIALQIQKQDQRPAVGQYGSLSGTVGATP